MKVLKKVFVLIAIFICSVILIYASYSYTNARISNDAVLTITESENALIALPNKIEKGLDIYKTITKDYILEKVIDAEGNISENKKLKDKSIKINIEQQEFRITNNLSYDINRLKVDFEESIFEDYIYTFLGSGRSTYIPISIPSNQVSIDEVSDSSKYITPITIYAEWEGGSARIESEIILNINLNISVNSRIVDEIEIEKNSEDNL